MNIERSDVASHKSMVNYRVEDDPYDSEGRRFARSALCVTNERSRTLASGSEFFRQHGL